MVSKVMYTVTLVVVCVTIGACGKTNDSAETKPGASPESQSSASQAEIQSTIVSLSPSTPILAVSGRIDFAENHFSKISSPLSGRVLDVQAKLGDRVSEGAVLLVIDSPDIARAYTAYVKEISEFTLAKRNYELASDLYKVQAMPLKDFQQAKNDFNRESAELRQAEQALLTLRVPAAELKKPLEQQHIQSRYKLKSPLTGTVVERNVTPGQLVIADPNQVLFTVVDLDILQVVADVYEQDLGLLTVGQVAAVTVLAEPDKKFPATIAVIDSIVDPTTRTIKVRASVDNRERKLKPAMYARLHIPVGEDVQHLVIPQQAVVEEGGKEFVYAEDKPGHYQRREVRIEKVRDNQVRILEGLTAGERIAVKGAVLLKAMEKGS